MELGKHFLFGKIFSEHHAFYERDFLVAEDAFETFPKPIYFKGNQEHVCFSIKPKSNIENSYFIGIDWIIPGKAVCVQPKINTNFQQTNYLAMLFGALKHPDVFEHTEDLFEIKWDRPEISINQQQDLLTPLLIVQFLQIVKTIVRKGLKKSYYKVEQNLRNRVKGKVLVSATLKNNRAKGKVLNTICSYDEFGFNGIENRVLKKALTFIQRYLPSQKQFVNETSLMQIFNYIMPGFEQVSENANIRECQNLRTSPFYKEYKLAIDLAKIILRRFGYNINNVASQNVTTPPFWIDMSKLFELYVLGLLKDEFGSDILYGSKQAKANFGLPDYLLTRDGSKMIIDAKYKLLYNGFDEDESGLVKSTYAIENIRQLAGYARDNRIFSKLKVTNDKIIDCLIIYPNKELGQFTKIFLEEKIEISQFASFYKLGVNLPFVKN